MNSILGAITAALALGLVVQTARLSSEKADHANTVAKHQKAVADHNAAVAALKTEQAEASAELAATHARIAEAEAAAARADTTDRIERIRYVTRTVPAPAGAAPAADPVVLPDGVRDILAEAVDAANAASRGVRARPDGRRAAGPGDAGPGLVVGMGGPGPGIDPGRTPAPQLGARLPPGSS